MKQSTKDKVRGGAREISGKIKEKTGRAINDPRLEEKGRAEKVSGRIQKKVGDIEKVFDQ